MPIPGFGSRQDLFDFLDGYAEQRKTEIDRLELGKGKGLIKSYVLETAPASMLRSNDSGAALRSTGWRLDRMGQGDLWRVYDVQNRPMGYLEALSQRYLLLHSIEEARWIDRTVEGDIRETASLDTMWLAGTFFSSLWDMLIVPQLPNSYVKLKFEHLARFEDGTEEAAARKDQEIQEHRASSLMISERVHRIADFLPKLRELHPPFKAVRMLRIPSTTGRGGYEFWTEGKITYRAHDFRDGRSQVVSITRLYEQVTEAIEQNIWLQVEKREVREGLNLRLKGAPVTLEFSTPLEQGTFQNFITTTFERGQGPLRLWGNPIYLGEKRAHVYGIDLHLWQRIYLDLTPKRFVAILPQGTCGNTVHRLVTNTQRYLDPGVTTYIGDKSYNDVIRDVLLGKRSAA